MAVFNYSGSYSTISPYIQTGSNAVAAADLLKIFISPDTGGAGHLITRGIDLTPTFTGGKRGLVPTISTGLTTHFLRGDGWSALWNSTDEAAAVTAGTSDAYLSGTLVSAKDIKQWIALSFIANDAMQFKGVINIGASSITSSTTNANGFPNSCVVGDTYKVSGDSTVVATYIAGQPVTTGDLVICIKAGTGNNLNTDEYWTIVLNNVEHLITVKVNGTDHRIYSQSANNITFYAPTGKGTTSTFGPQVLVSGQGASTPQDTPIWVNLETLKVGEAAKVTNSLTAGTGLAMQASGSAVTTYNGNTATTINLVQATSSNLGGIKVGYTTSGKNFQVQLDASGNAYVNVPYIDSVFTSSANGLVPMSSTANKQTSNTDNVASTTTFLLGADAKWYKLPSSAFVGTWRNIKVGGTEILDTSVLGGLALNLVAGGKTSIVAEQVNSAYTGKVTISSTWRDIFVHKVTNGSMGVNAVTIGDNNPLEFENSDSVFLLGEDTTSGGNTKTTIKAYVVWYNVDTSEYELV